MHKVHGMVVSSVVELTLNESAMFTTPHAKAVASIRLAKTNRASHGPRVLAKERAVTVRENPKDNPKVPKVPKIRTRVKPRELVYLVWRNRNQRQVRRVRNLHRCIPLTVLSWTILGLMMAGVLEFDFTW